LRNVACFPYTSVANIQQSSAYVPGENVQKCYSKGLGSTWLCGEAVALHFLDIISSSDHLRPSSVSSLNKGIPAPPSLHPHQTLLVMTLENTSESMLGIACQWPRASVPDAFKNYDGTKSKFNNMVISFLIFVGGTDFIFTSAPSQPLRDIVRHIAGGLGFLRP